MYRYKTLTSLLMVTIISGLLIACSNESANTTPTGSKDDDTKEVTASQPEQSDKNVPVETEQIDEEKDEVALSGEESETGNEEPVTDPMEGLPLADYLNKNYMIDDLHYTTESFGELEGTERTDYRVNIVPNNKEVSDELNEILQNGTTNLDERTDAMMNISRNIINDLPVINEGIHIDSVNWVSYDGSVEVMLIQDFNLDTLK